VLIWKGEVEHSGIVVVWAEDTTDSCIVIVIVLMWRGVIVTSLSSFNGQLDRQPGGGNH
jgi:hypothetical protein